MVWSSAAYIDNKNYFSWSLHPSVRLRQLDLEFVVCFEFSGQRIALKYLEYSSPLMMMHLPDGR